MTTTTVATFANIHGEVDVRRPASLQAIVFPVLDGMKPSALKRALIDAFSEEEQSLASIEQCFADLTARRQEAKALRYFFQSWSQTNNSAASVAGLANRMTLAADRLAAGEARSGCLGIVASLQRIIDEDLGALGGVLHSDLFYRMATTICGDDGWQSKQYCVPAGRRFREWRDQQRLRQPDMLRGLLHTLVHEVYTHGEVELIHEMFHKWLPAHMNMSTTDARKVLAWITVHTGGTESNHFRHATEAVDQYCAATGATIDELAAKNLFAEYLRRKAAVMEEISGLFQ